MIKCQVSSSSKRVSIFVGFIPPFHSSICGKARKSSSGRGYSHQCLFCSQDGALLRAECISLEVTTSSTFNCFLEVTENRGKYVGRPRNAGRLCNSRKPLCYLLNVSPEIPRAKCSWRDYKKTEGFTKLHKN